jgi:hypothetical protein
MKTTRAQKKAELQASSEAIIERLLEWEERNQAPNLTALEDELLDLRKQFGVAMLQVVIEGQEARQPVMNPVCEGCGQAMRPKGKKGRDVVSRLGELEVKRSHYYCKDCASGLFPPRPATGLGQ